MVDDLIDQNKTAESQFIYTIPSERKYITVNDFSVVDSINNNNSSYLVKPNGNFSNISNQFK
jgi:hypothetical protein